MAYLPFGEILFEEHSSSFSSPNLFNGKELDRETNMTYYGGRYLDMKTSLWLNVDPLAEKYYSHSPYNYCFNNPINYTDPDGRFPLPLITGAIGATAGLIYGIATGKSMKETLALTAGGFVAGATLGFGTLAVSAVGGVAATGTTGAIYMAGASSIVGGMLGNATEQAINNNGFIDKNEVLINGVYGIPDALLGGAIGKITKGTESRLSNYFESKLATKTSEKSLKIFKKQIAKDLREKGLGRRESNKAANRVIDSYKNALEEGFQATQTAVKITGKTIDVSLSAVQVGTLEQIK